MAEPAVTADDLPLRSAREAAEALRLGEVSSRELVEMLLARIETINPTVNAIVGQRQEQARREAAEADQAIAAGEAGPLTGVPITVKEALDVTGMHTTWGNPAFEDYIAGSDATAVSRLRQTGAIVLGKTNAHLMLADFAQTFNEVYGATANPWDPDRVPGGSSGGSAAAIASGMSFLELGSDLVGSIRIPASFCGVYGLRPSADVVPLTGLQPGGIPAPPNETTYMSTVGPLARSPGDLRTALSAIAGPEAPAANAYSWTLGPPRHTRLADYRVGFVLDHDRGSVTSEVGDVLSALIDALAAKGSKLVEGWPEGIDPAAESESFGYQVELFFAFQTGDSGFTGLPSLIEQEYRRLGARAAWSEYFREVDVFVCPTNFTAAFPHDTRPFEERTIETPEGDRRYDEQSFWISHAALPGLPAMSAPVGRGGSGLPVGAQIVGPLFEDATPLSFAELLADELGGYEPPPIATRQGE